MNDASLQHDRTFFQYLRQDKTPSGPFNREARSSENHRSIDHSRRHAPTSSSNVAHHTDSEKSDCPSSTSVPRNQEHNNISPDLRTISATPRFKETTTGFMMMITISAESVTSLRRIVIDTFGELVAFIRIQSIDHATKMNVCLCLTGPISDRVMDAIMHALPGAEFGRISPA